MDRLNSDNSVEPSVAHRHGSADHDESRLVVDDEVVGVLSVADASNAAGMDLEDDWNPLAIHSTLS